MKLSQQSQSLIESAVQKAFKAYPGNKEQTIVTDIHLQPIQNSGELIIFDDDDNELACVIIEEWISYEEMDFYKDIERILRSILNRMKDHGSFGKVPVLQPYSFVLVDEDKETLAELLIMDEDILIVNEELLKGLDEELDKFLKDLLEN